MTIRDFHNPVDLDYALAEIEKNTSYKFIWYTVVNQMGNKFELCGNVNGMRAFFPKMEGENPIENLRFDTTYKNYMSDGTIEFDFEIGWNVDIDPIKGFDFKSKAAFLSYLKNATMPEPIVADDRIPITEYSKETDFFEAIRYEIGMLTIDYNDNPKFNNTDLNKYTVRINQLLNNLEIYTNKK
jgi:hypothetical protein